MASAAEEQHLQFLKVEWPSLPKVQKTGVVGPSTPGKISRATSGCRHGSHAQAVCPARPTRRGACSEQKPPRVLFLALCGGDLTHLTKPCPQLHILRVGKLACPLGSDDPNGRWIWPLRNAAVLSMRSERLELHVCATADIDVFRGRALELSCDDLRMLQPSAWNFGAVFISGHFSSFPHSDR